MPRFQKIVDYLLLVLLFLLPWQTRLMYEQGVINGAAWEYGTKSLYGTELLLSAAVLGGVGALLQSRQRWSRKVSRRTYWLGVSSVMLVLVGSIVASIAPAISYQFVIQLLLGGCLLVLIARSELATDRLSLALWLGGLGQAFFGLWQFFAQEVLASKWLGLASHIAKELGASVVEFGDERWLRAYGSFGSPNSLGIYLAVVLVLGLVLYLKTESVKIKIAVTLGQLIIVAGLIVSFSRGAWVAAAAGLVVLGMYAFQRNLKIAFFKQLFFYLLVVSFFVYTLTPLFATRLQGATRLEQRSLGERQSQLSEAWSVWKEHPLLGVGPGAYTAYLHLRHTTLPAYDLQPVHNIYVLAVVEWGVFTVVGGMLLYIFWLFKLLKQKKWLLGAIVVLLVSGLFDHWLYSLFTGQLLWFTVWGLGLHEALENKIPPNDQRYFGAVDTSVGVSTERAKSEAVTRTEGQG